MESDARAADGSKAPLTAAGAMASGIGSFDEIADANCKVIIEAEDTKKR